MRRMGCTFGILSTVFNKCQTGGVLADIEISKFSTCIEDGQGSCDQDTYRSIFLPSTVYRERNRSKRKCIDLTE